MATKQQTISCYQGGWNKVDIKKVTVLAAGKWADYSVHIQSIVRINTTTLYGYVAGVKKTTNVAQIGLVISTDDGDTWPWYDQNDGLILGVGAEGSGYEGTLFAPNVKKIGNKFHMIFCGAATVGAPQSWFHATSDNGITNWTIAASPILAPGLTYDALQMIPGHGIVQDGSTYYLPYTAQSSVGAASGSIAMASFTVVNDVITGITKHGIVLAPRAGQWDASLLEPCLRVYGTKKYMFYQADNLANPENFTAIGVAICDTFTGAYVHQNAINPIVYPDIGTWQSRWNEAPTIFTRNNGIDRMMYGACMGLDDTTTWLEITYADFVKGADLIIDLSLLDDAIWDEITIAANIAIVDNNTNVKTPRLIELFSKAGKAGFATVSNTVTTPSIATFKVQAGATINETNSTAPLTTNNYITNIGFDEASGAVVDSVGNYSGKTMTGTQNRTGLIGKAALFDANGAEYNMGVVSQLTGATKLQIKMRCKFNYSGAFQNTFYWWNDDWVIGMYLSAGGAIIIGIGAAAANNVAFYCGTAYTPWLVGDLLTGWHQYTVSYDAAGSGNTGRVKLSIDGFRYINYAASVGTIPAALPDNTGKSFHVGEAGINNMPTKADVDQFSIRTNFNLGDEKTAWNNVSKMSTFWTLGAVESVGKKKKGGAWSNSPFKWPSYR